MTILKNIQVKLIAHTSPHKSKDSMFSEKLNDFYNEITKDFSPLEQFVLMTNQYLLPGLKKCFFNLTISATVTVLK